MTTIHPQTTSSNSPISADSKIIVFIEKEEVSPSRNQHRQEKYDTSEMSQKEVADQKEQALRKLDAVAVALGTDNLPDRLVQSIRTDLEGGFVPPIFHALAFTSMKKKNKAPLPSAESVTAAESYVTSGENATFHMGPRATRFQLEMFLDMPGGAPSEIVDSDGKWEADSIAAASAASLVNQKASMIGGGIEVTKVDYLFGIDGKRAKSDQESAIRIDALLTRPQSRGAVARYFYRLEYKGNTAAVVGSPGIGKSWSLLYALQQGLLYEDATVMVQASARNIRFLLIRRNNKIYAWSMDCKGLEAASSKLFHRKTTLVLYDPPEVSKDGGGGAKYAEGERGLIAFLSANTGHSTQKSSKHSAGVANYLAHPSSSEIRLMLPYLTSSSDISEQIVMERALTVGNLPRYLLDKDAYKERTDKLHEAINKIEADNDYFLKVLNSGGQALLTDTLPGTLFTVCARRRLLEREEEMDDDDDDEVSGKPSPEMSDIVEDVEKIAVGTTTTAAAATTTTTTAAAVPVDTSAVDDGPASTHEDDAMADLDDDDAVLYEPQDYDAGHFDYADRVVSVLTDIVLTKILNANRRVVLSYWGLIDSAQFADMGQKVKHLFIQDLQRESCAFPRYKLGDAEKVGQDILHLGSKNGLLDLRNLDEEQAFQKLRDVFDEQQNVVVLFKAGFVLIDCAGPGRRVYQVTVGENHSMSVNGMKKLLLAAGFLQEDAVGNLTKGRGVDAGQMLEFYWVVAPARFSSWAKKSPKKFSTVGPKTSEKRKVADTKKILNKFLAEHVVQYALKVPEDLDWLAAKRAKSG